MNSFQTQILCQLLPEAEVPSCIAAAAHDDAIDDKEKDTFNWYFAKKKYVYATNAKRFRTHATFQLSACTEGAWNLSGLKAAAVAG